MKIFSGSSNRPLAEKIAKELNLRVSPIEIFVFPDGERRIRVLEKVLGEDTVVVQTTSTPVDERYMELFFMVDALKRYGAKSVTVVIPYLGYQRQDHIFREGEAVSLEVVVKTLQATGIDRVILFDLHTIKIAEQFSVPVSAMSALPVFEKTIKDKKLNTGETALVSPDLGGIRRIKILADALKLPMIAIVKDRNLATGDISATEVRGKVLKRAIIVDDMISTGGTMVTGANLLKSKGAQDLYIFATHAVFSKDAPKILQKSIIKEVYVSDTIDVPANLRFPKLHVVTIAKEVARKLSE